jgi:hypothetical protein
LLRTVAHAPSAPAWLSGEGDYANRRASALARIGGFCADIGVISTDMLCDIRGHLVKVFYQTTG